MIFCSILCYYMYSTRLLQNWDFHVTDNVINSQSYPVRTRFHPKNSAPAHHNSMHFLNSFHPSFLRWLSNSVVICDLYLVFSFSCFQNRALLPLSTEIRVIGYTKNIKIVFKTAFWNYPSLKRYYILIRQNNSPKD